MKWTFRILAGLNLAFLALALLYSSPGEDPAGQGMRMGFAVVYAIALGVVLLLYRVAKTDWVRAPLLIVLALPLIWIVFGAVLSF